MKTSSKKGSTSNPIVQIQEAEKEAEKIISHEEKTRDKKHTEIRKKETEKMEKATEEKRKKAEANYEKHKEESLRKYSTGIESIKSKRENIKKISEKNVPKAVDTVIEDFLAELV